MSMRVDEYDVSVRAVAELYIKNKEFWSYMNSRNQTGLIDSPHFGRSVVGFSPQESLG